MVFHGDGRAKLPENLIENDLVLTTYATLVADCKGPAVLQRIAWFRVVLDEDKAALSSRLMKLANCWISPLDSKSNLATISSFRNAPRATQMVFDWYTDSKPARRSPLSVEVSSLRAILSTVHIPEICTGSFERRELWGVKDVACFASRNMFTTKREISGTLGAMPPRDKFNTLNRGENTVRRSFEKIPRWSWQLSQ